MVGADVSGSTGADVGDKVVGGSGADEVDGGTAVEASGIGAAATVVGGSGAEDVGRGATVVGTGDSGSTGATEVDGIAEDSSTIGAAVEATGADEISGEVTSAGCSVAASVTSVTEITDSVDSSGGVVASTSSGASDEL